MHAPGESVSECTCGRVAVGVSVHVVTQSRTSVCSFNGAEVYFEQDWFFVSETVKKPNGVAELLEVSWLARTLVGCGPADASSARPQSPAYHR